MLAVSFQWQNIEVKNSDDEKQHENRRDGFPEMLDEYIRPLLLESCGVR